MKGKVVCPVDYLFLPIKENLELYLYSEVKFLFKGKEHCIFVNILDKPTAEKSAGFYLDDIEYDSLEDMKKNAVIDGFYLDTIEEVEVTSVDNENPCYYIPYTNFIVGNDKLKEKNNKFKERYNKKIKKETGPPITKKSLAFTAIKPLATILFIVALFIVLLMAVVSFIYRDVNNMTLTDNIMMSLFIFIIFFFITLACAVGAYKGLWVLRRQEKALNIDFNEALSGYGLELLSGYWGHQSRNWFIRTTASGNLIVFNRHYIKDIKKETNGMSMKLTVFTTDNKKVAFSYVDAALVSNFQSWLVSKT